MARLVMKFGGTSVATVERIKNAARHVKREFENQRIVENQGDQFGRAHPQHQRRR